MSNSREHDDFDDVLRAALREPASAEVPAAVRAVEVDAALRAADDALAWSADDDVSVWSDDDDTDRTDEVGGDELAVWDDPTDVHDRTDDDLPDPAGFLDRDDDGPMSPFAEPDTIDDHHHDLGSAHTDFEED